MLSLEADSAVHSFTRENQAGGLLFIHLFIHDIVGCLSHAILMKFWLKSIHFIAFLLKIIKQHHFTQSVNFSKPIISPSPSYPHHIPMLSIFWIKKTPKPTAPQGHLCETETRSATGRQNGTEWNGVTLAPGNVGALSHETPLLPSGYDSQFAMENHHAINR